MLNAPGAQPGEQVADLTRERLDEDPRGVKRPGLEAASHLETHLGVLAVKFLDGGREEVGDRNQCRREVAHVHSVLGERRPVVDDVERLVIARAARATWWWWEQSAIGGTDDHERAP